jgi:hypothetical protein
MTMTPIIDTTTTSSIDLQWIFNGDLVQNIYPLEAIQKTRILETNS